MLKLMMKSVGLILNICSVIAPDFTGRIGFKLFCYPIRPKLKKRYREFLKSAIDFEMNYEGDRVVGYKWGNGTQKVLLLHGWQSHTYRWKSYIDELLKSDYTIYAFDAPAHGLSEGSFLTVPRYSAVIEMFLNKIGHPDYIISHSIGSFSALYTLFRLPDLRPQKVVMLSPPGGAVEFFSVFSGMLGLTERTVGVIRKRFVELVNKEPEYYVASNFAGSMTADGLLIHDEDDEQTPVSNSVSINKLWPNSKLIITKGLGHSLKSHQIVKKVVRFIGSDIPIDEQNNVIV